MDFKEKNMLNDLVEIHYTSEIQMESMMAKFIRPAIYELCFSFCIDIRTVYDMLYELYELRMQFKERDSDCNDGDYKWKEYYTKAEFDRLCYFRLQNATKRFVDMNSFTKFSGFMLDKNRIYDSAMYEEMVILHLKFMEKYHDMKGYERFMKGEIERIRKFPEQRDEYKYTKRINREEKFTLLEAILYSGILCCTEGRSINVVNKELIENRDYERAEKWFSKLSTVFFSDEFRDSVIGTVVGFVYYKVAKYCNELLEDCKTFEKKAKKISGKRNLFETEYRDELYTKRIALWGYNKLRINLLIAELIATGVFPTELSVTQGEKMISIFEGENDKVYALNYEMESLPEGHTITVGDYNFASELAKVLLDFVEDALKGATNLLKCLPETVVVGNKEIYDYLKEKI